MTVPGTDIESLREATEQLEVVNRVVSAVNSSRTIEEVFNLASEQMRALIPFDRASIALCLEDGESLRVFAISGEHVGSLAIGATAAMRGSVTAHALALREIVSIPKIGAETRFNVYEDLHREGFHSAVCCPLFAGERAIGSLNVTSRTAHAYTGKHLLALERLAPPFAIAIEKALLLEQAERRSREMEAAARREELAGQIGRQIAGLLEPEAIFQGMVDALGSALGADRCRIVLLGGDARSALVDYEYLSGAAVSSLRDQQLPLLESKYVQRVLGASEPVAVGDIREIQSANSTQLQTDDSTESHTDNLIELYERLGVRAMLTAPLAISGVYWGLLELHDCRNTREWTNDDIRLLKVVAAQVSVALTNARLFEASRRRSIELEGLYKISRAFSTLTDTSEIYGLLTRAIAELIGGELCLIAAYDRRRNLVRAEAPGYNVPPQMIGDFRFSLDQDGASEFIYRTGKPFFSNDPLSDERFNKWFASRYDLRSVLGVPIRIKQELIGFIYVANRPGGFREGDVRLLEIFSTQAAETIANARLFATIQAQAEREAVVNRLLLSLQSASDSKQGMEMVVERLGEVMDLDRCVAVLYGDNDGIDVLGEWCVRDVSGVTGDTAIRDRSPVAHWIRTHRQPLVVADARTHPMAAGITDLIEKIGLRSLAVVPIIHQGRVIGSLSAHQTRAVRQWTADDVDLLTAVATQIGSTLDNARLIAELREANRLKDEFLATLSHELRTPLTAIRGWVELLSENDALEHDEELADGINVIKNATSSLTQLISDLLDLSRIQRRGVLLECSPSDINVAALDAAQSVRQTATARRQTLQLELGEHLPHAFVDLQRIKQVLLNLLTNAIKFTPEGGRIIIRSRLLDSGGIFIEDDEGEASRWVVLEVEDNGEGIPADFIPFLWDRFRQADSSSTRRHGGLGIGLALVKELVEAHGGNVEARSDGGGAIFTVRLPVTGTGMNSRELIK